MFSIPAICSAPPPSTFFCVLALHMHPERVGLASVSSAAPSCGNVSGLVSSGADLGQGKGHGLRVTSFWLARGSQANIGEIRQHLVVSLAMGEAQACVERTGPYDLGVHGVAPA
eukprot:4305561-Alexandrium_andersonii.AAC.1